MVSALIGDDLLYHADAYCWVVGYCDARVDDEIMWCCVFQAEDGIRYLVRSRGLGDVYKRQHPDRGRAWFRQAGGARLPARHGGARRHRARDLDLSLIHI